MLSLAILQGIILGVAGYAELRRPVFYDGFFMFIGSLASVTVTIGAGDSIYLFFGVLIQSAMILVTHLGEGFDGN
jgi:hypothetical protein